MMDGRIKVIRESLDKSSFHNTIIMSYAAKYASAFYGPFRNAISASNNLGPNKKKSYQMDYNNYNEALKEVSMDIKEGADIILILPSIISEGAIISQPASAFTMACLHSISTVLSLSI